MAFSAIINDGRSDRMLLRCRCDIHQAFLDEAARQRNVCKLMGWTARSYNIHRDEFWFAVVNLRAVRAQRTTSYYQVKRALDARALFDDYQSYCAGAEDNMCKGVEMDDRTLEKIYHTDFDYGEGPKAISEAEWNLSDPKLVLDYARSSAAELEWLNKCDLVGGTRVWSGGLKPKDYITDQALERHKKEYEEKTRTLAYDFSLKCPTNSPEENWELAECQSVM